MTEQETVNGISGVPKTLWTRIVTIHPADYNDDIRIDLIFMTLQLLPENGDSPTDDDAGPKYQAVNPNDSSPQQYEALSYVWGHTTSPGVVFMGPDRRTIPITGNLDIAIRHLRYTDRARVLWIDALCIDQQNIEERGRQVAYMTHIYWSTPRVVVWLGPEADDSTRAMEIANSVGARIHVNWFTMSMTGITDEDEEAWGEGRNAVDMPFSEQDWTAIHTPAERSWFERIWIRQEIFRSQDEAVVTCGKSSVSLEPFRRGLWRLTWEFPQKKGSIVVGCCLRPIDYSLFWLKDSIQGALCTDPRDYIYGLMGMLKEQEDMGIIPDYSKSTATVYREVTLRYIEVYHDLQILEIWHSDESVDESASPFEIEVPTWVPNWSVGVALPRFLSFRMCPGALGACSEYLGNGILRVAGIAKGTIKDLFGLEARTPAELQNMVRTIVPDNAAQLPYPGGGNLWDAYQSALCGDCLSDRSIPKHTNSLLTSEESKVAMENIMLDKSHEAIGADGTWVKESLEFRFDMSVFLMQLESQFFVSDEGLIGWAPLAAEEGDVIACMLGGDTPMVLRLVPSRQGQQFKVIGPCYLQGFMYGEAFLGPLPPPIWPIKHWDEEGNTYFHDTATGKIHLRDPRLASMPIDPDALKRWEPGGRRIPVEVDVLQSHGLTLKYFDLV